MASNIVIKLTLDDNNFSGKITGAKADLASFKKAVGSANQGMRQAEKSTRSWGSAMRDSIIVLGLSRHALMNLDAVFLSLPRSIITASGELERMTQLMRGLSDETTNYADIAKRADSDTNFVLNMSQASPFEVQTLTDSFVKFRSVGLDPTNGSLQALVDSVAKFGGSKEQLHRASIAIQQMAGKGVISMEEMRQQLAESVPDAMKLMARGTGKAMGELVDQISKGAVASQGALQAMFRQMAIENSGAALEMSQTWTGLTNRLQTQMMLFKKAVGDAGYFDEVKEQLRFIVEDVLSSPEAGNFAKSLGEGLATLVKSVRLVVDTFYEWREEIVLLGKVTATYFLGKATLSVIIERTAMASKAATVSMARHATATWSAKASLDALTASMTRTLAAGKALALTNVTLAGTMATVKTSARVLGAALWSLVGGPIGAIAIAVAWAVYEYDSLKDKHLETMEEIKVNQPDLITKDQIDSLEASFKKYEENLAKIEELKSGKIKGVKYLIDRGESKWFNSLQEEVKEFEETLKRLNLSKEKYQELKNTFAENQHQRALNSTSAKVSTKASQDLRALINQYKVDVDKITESSSATKEKEKEALDQHLKESFEKYFDDQLSEAKKARQAILDQSKGFDSKELELANRKIEALKEVAKRQLSVFDLDAGGIDEQKAKKTNDQNKKLDNEITKLSATYEKLSEKINGGAGELEKFREIAARKYDSADKDKIAEVEALIVKNEDLKKKIKEITAANKDFEKSLADIGKINTSISNSFAKRQNQNPFLKNSLHADTYRRKLEALQQSIGALDVGSDKILDTVDALEQIESALDGLDENATAATIAVFDDAAQDIRNSLLPEYDKIKGKHEKIIDQLKEWHKKKKDVLNPQQEQSYKEYLAALNAQMIRELETPFDSLMRQWGDTTKNMNNLWSDSVSGFVDTLADGLASGELEMEKFEDSFKQMIARMVLRKAASGLFNMLGITGGASAGSGQIGAGGESNMGFFANGGIMTKYGSLALEKYAKGGIANRPQVAVYGEGSQPEAYVPLPDGRTIPVTMEGGMSSNTPDIHFNLINESSQGIEAVPQGDMKFDGEKMILDVVLKNVSRPGSFRDSMRGSMR